MDWQASACDSRLQLAVEVDAKDVTIDFLIIRGTFRYNRNLTEDGGVLGADFGDLIRAQCRTQEILVGIF